MAVLELVDNPRDLKFAMTARATGWEILARTVGDRHKQADGMLGMVNEGVSDLQQIVEREKNIPFGKRGGLLKGKTRWNLQKVLRFRDETAVNQFSQEAKDYTVCPAPGRMRVTFTYDRSCLLVCARILCLLARSANSPRNLILKTFPPPTRRLKPSEIYTYRIWSHRNRERKIDCGLGALLEERALLHPAKRDRCSSWRRAHSRSLRNGYGGQSSA